MAEDQGHVAAFGRTQLHREYVAAALQGRSILVQVRLTFAESGLEQTLGFRRVDLEGARASKHIQVPLIQHLLAWARFVAPRDGGNCGYADDGDGGAVDSDAGGETMLLMILAGVTMMVMMNSAVLVRLMTAAMAMQLMLNMLNLRCNR